MIMIRKRRNNLRRQDGVALILCLLVMGMLVLLVLAFIVSMRTEESSASYGINDVTARLMAEAAVDNAIAHIITNTPTISPTNFWVSQPGRITGFPSTGANNDLLYPVNPANPTNDLNSKQYIISQNAEYSSGQLPIKANWIKIYTNGLTSGAQQLGQYTYWVDDEATKVSINSARTRANSYGSNPQDVDLTALPGVTGTIATNSYTYATSTGYFSTEQWKNNFADVGSYLTNQSYVTAFGDTENITPWGTPKFNLNGTLATFQTELNAGCPTTLAAPGLTNFFGSTFANKYGNYVDHLGVTHVNDNNLIKQMAANIADYPRTAFSAGAVICTGAQTASLEPAASAPGISLVPTFYCGLRNGAHLNEIALQATYWRPTASSIECKVWVTVELMNPYTNSWGNGNQILINMDKLVYRVSDSATAPTTNYFAGMDTGWVANAATPVPNQPVYSSAQEVSFTIPADLPAKTYTNYAIAVYAGNPESAVTLTNPVIDQVYVRVNKVRLLQTPGNNQTIRDWAIIGDWDMRSTGDHCVFSNDTVNVKVRNSPTGDLVTDFVTPAVMYSNAFQQGIAKNDPRVRRFTRWTPPGTNAGTTNQLPWTAVGYDRSLNTSLGSGNTGVVGRNGTGIPNIDCDPGESPGTTTINKPDFLCGKGLTFSPYVSPGEMGRVHSGLQWRSIRLQPAPTNELAAGMIPDWALLDIFTATNNILGRVNINGTIKSLSADKLRSRPAQALVTAVGDPFGPATDQPTIAANIASMTWAPTSTWGTQRTTAPFKFTAGVYNLIGELCEVDKAAANYTGATNDVWREARITSFVNLVTVRSSTFTVYGVGQATDTSGNPTAETTVQAIVQRIPGTPPTYKVINYRYLE